MWWCKGAGQLLILVFAAQRACACSRSGMVGFDDVGSDCISS